MNGKTDKSNDDTGRRDEPATVLPADSVDDADPFDGYEARDYERWLRVGLEGYLLEDADVWAFTGAEHVIAGPVHLVKGLGKFHRRQNAARQSHFRQAIADLLSVLPGEERYIPLFGYLLSLAVEVRAYEILRVLPNRIGNGFFGLTDNHDGEDLFSRTLRTVAQLAAPRKETVDCLRTLIGSRHFDHAYAGLALVALCHADSKNFLDHMNLLRRSLATMFREFDTDGEGRRDLAESVLDGVGLHRVVEALPHLVYFPGSERAPWDDTWFLDALLAGRKVPLVCRETAKDWIEFHTRDQEKISESLPREGPGSRGLIEYLQKKRYIHGTYPPSHDAVSSFQFTSMSVRKRRTSIEKSPVST